LIRAANNAFGIAFQLDNIEGNTINIGEIQKIIHRQRDAEMMKKHKRKRLEVKGAAGSFLFTLMPI
jgi:hypothetical protein